MLSVYMLRPRFPLFYIGAKLQKSIFLTIMMMANVHMNHVIRLKKLDQYNPSFLPFEKLKAYGIGAVRGPRRMPHSLICELERNRYEQ